MKAIIAGAAIFCVALIGLGAFIATREGAEQARIVPIHAEYVARQNAKGWVKGADTPLVVVEEYGDFQCPGCAAAQPVLSEALRLTDSYVQFIYRNYPLPQHNKARLAAKGAEAAGRQGKYWDMHEILYATQQNWTNTSVSAFKDELVQRADALGLNTEQFRNDLNDSSIDGIINEDVTAGNNVPVTQTPTILINGVMVQSMPSTAEAMVQLLEQARAAAAPASATTPASAQ